MDDPRIFDEFGSPIWLRSVDQNADYHRNIIGQYCFWLNNKLLSMNHRVKMTDKRIKYLCHERNKRVIIKPLFNKKSSTELTENEFKEFIAEFFLMMARKKIDLYEFGEL